MRRLAWILATLLGLVALALLLVLWRIDTEALRARVVDTASASLGEPVAIESLGLDFLPPALRVRGVRVGAGRSEEAALASVPEIRLGLKLLPLFSGQVVLGTVVVEGAHLRLPDATGSGASLWDSRASQGSEGSPEAALGLAFAADQVRIRDATLELGASRLEQVQADGSLSVDASGRLDRAVLALEGMLRGAHEHLAVDGPVELALRFPGRFELDLSGASLATASGAGKPAGTPLRVSGELAAAAPVEQISEGELLFGEARIPFAVKFDGESAALRMPSGILELALLGPLGDAGGVELGGRILYGTLQASAARDTGWGLSGEGRLDSVALPLATGSAHLRGRFRLQEQQIHLGPLELDFGGGPIGLRGLYALDSGSVEFESVTEDAEVAPMLAAFSDRVRVDGRLFGKLSLAGRIGGSEFFQNLSGRGRVLVEDGRIHGVSLLGSLEGSLASVPVLLARLGGRDLSRYEQEEFQRVSADFIVERGRAWTNNLVLEYRGARAELRGSVGLEGADLDLAGRVKLDVEAVPGAAASGSARVIPIAGVTGTLSQPRVRIEASTLLELASEYAAASPVLDKIEERIGRENVEAVKGLLDRILGGREGRR